MIISYKKYIDQITTRELRVPYDGMSPVGTELATIDDVTYVHLPDHTVLPEQPVEIRDSIVNPVTLTDDLKERIKATSPHCKLIAQRMIDKIRALYSIDDEMYFARIGVGAATGMYVPSEDEMHEMSVFGQFVESVRQWGRDERARIGL
jgi:hypothetical protein